MKSSKKQTQEIENIIDVAQGVALLIALLSLVTFLLTR